MIASISAAPTRPLYTPDQALPGRVPLGTAISFSQLSRIDQTSRGPVRQAPTPVSTTPEASPDSVLAASRLLGRLGLHDYSLKGFQPEIERATREYQALGARFQPSFVLDWGSFVNDDSTVVHLSLPKRNGVYRSLLQRGMADDSATHLVRHELAHAFLNTRWTPAVKREFEATFGPQREYDVTTWRIVLSNLQRSGPDFVSAYARTHPDEDFAETAAVYVKLGGDPVKLAHFILEHGGSEAMGRKFAFVRQLFTQP